MGTAGQIKSHRSADPAREHHPRDIVFGATPRFSPSCCSIAFRRSPACGTETGLWQASSGLPNEPFYWHTRGMSFACRIPYRPITWNT